MTQEEKRIYLINFLLNENDEYKNIAIPNDKNEQKSLLRALLNVRMPKKISDEFMKIQDEYLQIEIEEKGIIDYKNLEPIENGVYLWQGDITTLKCDAIVNAANSQMLGCFYPNHKCIDNAIHTFAGVELRLKMAEIMKGKSVDTSCAIITKAYNLPSKYIIHTVGPIVKGSLTQRDKIQLESCYLNCLSLADECKLSSIAFCCISTGEFGFPNDKACKTAVDSVRKYKEKTGSKIEVIFNVFKDCDKRLYERYLKSN